MSITTGRRGHRRNESLEEWLARVQDRGARIDSSQHYVYKAFDSFGLLLYIGCTINVPKRRAAHRNATWSRFSETLAIWGPYPDKASARAVESHAIENEGSYFNCTKADTARTQANRNAAAQVLYARGWYPYDDEGHYRDGWHQARDREAQRLKETTHPYLTDRDRLARYLAARQDAALALAEQVAS